MTIYNNVEYYIKYYKIQIGLKITLEPQKFHQAKTWCAGTVYVNILFYPTFETHIDVQSWSFLMDIN